MTSPASPAPVPVADEKRMCLGGFWEGQRVIWQQKTSTAGMLPPPTPATITALYVVTGAKKALIQIGDAKPFSTGLGCLTAVAE